MTEEIMSIKKRMQLLQRMKRMLINNEAAFLQALNKDLGKSQVEGYASELAILLNEIDFTLRRFKKWAKEKKAYELKIGYIAKITTRPAPYGRVLIISPWNYPLQNALMPAINAIAAGNTCVIKPSEYAQFTSDIMKEMIQSHFDENELCVVPGDAQVAQKLIAGNFDLIFFTGSSKVGRKVVEQASANWTPVIMELGGKNACIVDESAFSEEHIREIVWGKFFNAGQTCVAPDTLYVPEQIFDQAVEMVKKVIIEFYSEIPEESADFGRIINDDHFKRVKALLDQGTIVHGGGHDQSQRFISPTVMIDIDQSSELSKEEIFSPILPIVPYTDLELLIDSESIRYDALTTYLFTKKSEQIAMIRKKVKGMVSVNKVIHHAGSSRVPYGGIGQSGFGVHHGKAGFTQFSHLQTDYQAYNYKYLREKYPPYSKELLLLLRRLRKWLF